VGYCPTGCLLTGKEGYLTNQPINRKTAVKPIIESSANSINLSWDGVIAEIPKTGVCIAHLGCKQLHTIENVPVDLKEYWDRKIGPAWRNKKDATGKLAHAFRDAIKASNLQGAVLWDTMRNGSDYWRPGKLLSQVAELLKPCEISYAREDSLCPPQALLAAFMAEGSIMSFAQYAQHYCDYLHEDDRLSVAVAHVILNLARKQLPVFYCVDPYVPSYSNKAESFSEVPYAAREWEPRLREEGCHRVVLIEEIGKTLLRCGASLTVLEIDPPCQMAHVRRIESAAAQT
jgi:hypothetical protein